MTVRRLLVLACLCAALLSGLACTGERDNAAKEAPRLTAGEAEAVAIVKDISRTLAAADLFSGAVLVAKDGRVLFSKAYGSADRDQGTPNTLQTRFRIGSMNKMFTAVAILHWSRPASSSSRLPSASTSATIRTGTSPPRSPSIIS
jgi:CubicO group peptidase (beta-lactamase class C family)